jgi:hypothetical protein
MQRLKHHPHKKAPRQTVIKLRRILNIAIRITKTRSHRRHNARFIATMKIQYKHIKLLRTNNRNTLNQKWRPSQPPFLKSI